MPNTAVRLGNHHKRVYPIYMTKIQKTLVVPFSAEQMYQLVNNIESYPEFLPWCRAAEVHSRSMDAIRATIHLSRGPVQYSITTQNNMLLNRSIVMRYVDGPFKECEGTWLFQDNEGQCKIDFNMHYEFASRLKALLIEPVFHPIADTLVDSFHRRAQDVYGK